MSESFRERFKWYLCSSSWAGTFSLSQSRELYNLSLCFQQCTATPSLTLTDPAENPQYIWKPFLFGSQWRSANISVIFAFLRLRQIKSIQFARLNVFCLAPRPLIQDEPRLSSLDVPTPLSSFGAPLCVFVCVCVVGVYLLSSV